MKKKRFNRTAAVILVCVVLLAICLTGCSLMTGSQQSASGTGIPGYTQGSSSSGAESGSQTAVSADDLFTDRDLTQTADLSEARTIRMESGETYTVTEARVYVLTGTAENAQVIVEAGEEDKVQLVLDGLTVTNADAPVIYVKSADKVFVTSAGEQSSLSVTGAFTADGDTNTDAVIFSKEDLVLNGTSTVTIVSSDNGVSCKDDLKITGGVWNIQCKGDALEANDSIAMADGTVNIVSSKDGLHAEYDEDDTVGWIAIEGGTLTVKAADDGIHATTVCTVDGGELNVTAAEGIEATQVVINDGTVTISATDDGINAGQKSKALSVGITVNGGEIHITMGAGDTDAVDSNGYLTITGGVLDLYAQSPFDADGTVSWTGGTVYVNGSQASSISNQMMGGGMGGGGWGGGKPGGRP